MGYDMYIVELMSDEEESVYNELQKEFNAAAKYRDSIPRDTAAYLEAQEKVDAIYDEMQDSRNNYFRLNIWGMIRYRTVMEALGMLKHPAYGEFPPLPELMTQDEYYALSDFYYDGVDELGTEKCKEQCPWATPEMIEAVREHMKKTDEFLREHDKDTPGIASNKFDSNDGWVVTPGECFGAVQMYRRATEEEKLAAFAQAGLEDTEYFAKWIKFLDRAASKGGFRVY